MSDEKHEKTESQTPPVVEGEHEIRSSTIQVGDIIHVHASPEEEARVLRKIDWLYVQNLH